MKFWVGITDDDWYFHLSNLPDLDEVNFWQPSGGPQFRALPPGGLFLFKLHSPRNFIVGGGIFAGWSRLPVSLAWEAFETRNGAGSLAEMRTRVEKYRKGTSNSREDYTIGCILLEQPFFFSEHEWIPVPTDWHPNIQVGKGYGLDEVLGRRLWDEVRDRLARKTIALHAEGARLSSKFSEPAARFGEPTLVRPRLGQGSFRVLVTDAYERRCAVTLERTLPALEAAHIRPYSDGGEHRLDNGILLRRDLHALFDRGYVTIGRDLNLIVSQRIKQDFENGREYYAMQGRALRVPMASGLHPEPSFLEWHNQERYLG